MITVFYDERQSPKENVSFSPSAQKPAKVVESWKKLGIPFDLASFEPLSAEVIAKVHDRAYVEGILKGTIKNGFGNTSRQVAEALPWVCGSMAAATLHALQDRKPAFSPTSGAHHAHYDSAHGFCTFNFLVLAAVLAYEAGADRVGIFDLDCHEGDGTQQILSALGISYVQHYTFGAHYVNKGASADKWLASLERELAPFASCDVVLYNAGVDPHVDDPLGGILTTEQMRKRDEIVFQTLHRMNVPVATSLAGGYQRDAKGTIDPVLRLHDATFRECARALSEGVEK